MYQESVSSIIYHTTYPRRVVSILQSNQFILTMSLGSDAEVEFHPEYKPFYLSTSRIKFGGYATKFNETDICTLVLDGDKFNQRYEGNSVDFWGKDYRNPKTMPDIERRLKYDENEERIFSDKAIIKNAIDYIKEVHMMYDSNKLEIYKDDYIFDIAKVCKIRLIPLYVYTEFNHFKIMRKGKLWTGKDKNWQPSFMTYLNIINCKNKSELSNEELQKAKYLVHGYDNRYDSITTLKNDISNNRRESLYTKEFEMINKIMKQNKLKDLDAFLDYVSIIAKQKGFDT